MSVSRSSGGDIHLMPSPCASNDVVHSTAGARQESVPRSASMKSLVHCVPASGHSFSFGQKIETTQKRRSWQICRGAELRTASRVNFGCRGLMQYDIGRPVAALELLAGDRKSTRLNSRHSS